jgi:hypothetical protein
MYANYTTLRPDTTVNNYALLSALVGLKYYVTGRFYLSGQAGLVTGVSISGSNDAGTHLALAPSAGLLLPVKSSAVDISFRLVNVTGGGGIPESNNLRVGGYGFWSFRIAWALPGSKKK